MTTNANAKPQTCEHKTEADCAAADPLGHCLTHDFSVERYELERWGL